MNCEEFDNQLDACLDGQLADIDLARMSRHRESCANCTAAWKAARIVQQGLARLPEVTPPAGFAGRVIGGAVARAERQQARAFRLRLGGIAAVLALCAVVIGYTPFQRSEPNVQATVLLDQSVQLVRLAIDSAESVEQARLTITLSENLGIEGYGSRRTLSWNTSLKAGVNMLSLPVYAIAQGDGEIAASLEIGESQKEFIVKTKNPGAEMLRINALVVTT